MHSKVNDMVNDMDEKGHATAMNYRVKSAAVSAPRWQQTPSPDKFERKELLPKGNPT